MLVQSERKDEHILIGPRRIGCAHTCIDEAVVAMLEVGYIDAEYLVNVVGQVDIFHSDIEGLKFDHLGVVLHHAVVRAEEPLFQSLRRCMCVSFWALKGVA